MPYITYIASFFPVLQMFLLHSPQHGTPATCHSQLCVCRLVAHANNWTAACMYKIYYTTIEGIEVPGLYLYNAS